jgi:hypothetical protein
MISPRPVGDFAHVYRPDIRVGPAFFDDVMTHPGL